MNDVRERIEAMDDFQVTRFFNHFSNRLLEASTLSLDQIRAGVPAATRAVPSFATVEALTPENAEQTLQPEVAAATARNVLLHLADDERFAPVLARELEDYRDDELVAEVILTVGVVASVILLTATTEFEGQVGPFKIKKGAATADLIKAITEPFANALTNLVRPATG